MNAILRAVLGLLKILGAALLLLAALVVFLIPWRSDR